MRAPVKPVTGINVARGAVIEGDDKAGHRGGRAEWRFVGVGGVPPHPTPHPR